MSDDPQLNVGVLGKTEILAHLGEVAEELQTQGLTGSLVMVGGSYMALRNLRESTADVDPHLVDYVQQIADQARSESSKPV